MKSKKGMPEWVKWDTKVDRNGDLIIEVFDDWYEMNQWFDENGIRDLDDFLEAQREFEIVWEEYGLSDYN